MSATKDVLMVEPLIERYLQLPGWKPLRGEFAFDHISSQRDGDPMQSHACELRWQHA